MRRKRRVAVLFGGRSAEHEISCLSARSVIDALDPGRNEVVRDRDHARTGRWHLLPGPPALPPRPAGCRRSRGFGARRSSSSSRGARRAGDRRRVARRRSTWSSRCCTVRRRGRRDPGAAGAGRRAVRGGGGAGVGARDGQGRPEGAVRRRRSAGRAATRSCGSREWRGGPRGSRPRAPKRSATRCSPSRRPSGPPSASRRCTGRQELDAALEEAFRYAPQGRRRARHRAEPGDRVRGARQRRPGGVGRRRDRALGASSTTTRRSTSTSDGAELEIPARIGAGGAGAMCSGWRSPRSGRSMRRAWRGSTSSSAATTSCGERDQHDPRVHVDLDVPEAVGGERAVATRI